MLDQGPVGPHAELAAEHHIEGVRQGAARFVAELKSGDPALLAGALLVLLLILDMMRARLVWASEM